MGRRYRYRIECRRPYFDAMPRVVLSAVLFLLATDLAAQIPTTSTLNCTPNPAAISQQVDCGVSVSRPPGNSVPGSGRVTFYDGTTAIYSMSLLEGGAAFITSNLAQGVHPIT